MSSLDTKFDTNLIFLLKFRRFIPNNPFFQYFFIFSKFMPLFMICHDLNVHQNHYINSMFSYLTITRVFGLDGNGTTNLILFLIILLAFIYFFVYLNKYYQKVKSKDDPLAINQSSKSFNVIFIVFISTYVLLNQNIYEVLFSFFFCKGNQDPITKVVYVNTSCYDAGRYILMIISIALILLIIAINHIFNLIFFQPWFSTDCLIPSTFNGSNFIWTIMPLLQGYIIMEHDIPDDYSRIIRYVLRAIICLYILNFYFEMNQYVYVSKISYFLIIFMNSFNLISALIEFIPYISNNTNQVTFVIVKIGFQFTVAFIILYLISKNIEKKLYALSEWKSSPVIYELFSRYLYLVNNFEGETNEQEFEVIINQFLEIKIIQKNNEQHDNGNEFKAEDEDKITEMYNNMKSLFKIIKNSKTIIDAGRSKEERKALKNVEALQKNKNKLILAKLGFYIEYLDESFLSIISDEKTNEMLRYKYIILYSLFCNLIKRNFVSAFFYLEKLSFTRLYHNNFKMRLYYAQIKKLVCGDHFKIRIVENEEKHSLRKFFDNIKDFDKLYLNLKNATDVLKELSRKVNSDGVNLKTFTDLMSEVYTNLRVICLDSNKNLREVLANLNNTVENNALISKYVIFNDLVFKKTNTITEQSIFEQKDLYGPKANLNDKYAMAYLDENEDIYLLKVEKKTLALLGYEGVDIKGTNLLLIIPPTIGKYHKKLTTAFTKSNKDFRRLDLFFITKDKYNIPFSATLIIFPMFDDRIIFFVMAELFNKEENLNTGNPNQLPTHDFKCFAELNNQCEIVTINREFERVFGFNRDVIDSPSGKFNFITRLLRLQGDKIFNKFDHVQHYETRIPFVTLFDNLKKLNYDEFREYSLEAYYKFKSFITNFNLKKYPDVIMNIFIERRIIDRTDNDFFYYVVFSIDKNKKAASNMRPTSSHIQGESYIDEVNTPNLENLSTVREKKLNVISKEIIRMSKAMLKEGSRLWSGFVKYSDITDITGEDKIGNTFSLDNDKKKKGEHSTNPESTLFESDSNHSNLFNYKSFIMFLALLVFLVVFYSVFFNIIYSRYNMALQIFELNISILSLKNSQVMTALLLIQNFIVTSNQFPNNTQDMVTNSAGLASYVDSINNYVYQFQQTFSSLSSDDRYNSTLIGKYVNNLRNYTTIVPDFSIYKRNFTYYDSVDIYRLRVENFNYFDNMTFSVYPNTIVKNGLTYDVNKLYFNFVATQGDLLLYYIMNNMVDTTIPLNDVILQENRNILSNFISTLVNLEIVFYIVLFSILLSFFIYLYDYFYSGKKYIYERYFIMFNILKYFTPYLMRKVGSFDEILSNYTKDKYEYFMKLDFDISTENINSSLIRFDRENTNLMVFSGAERGKFEKKSSLFNKNSPTPTANTKTKNGKRSTVGNLNIPVEHLTTNRDEITVTKRESDHFITPNENTGNTNAKMNVDNSSMKSMRSDRALMKDEGITERGLINNKQNKSKNKKKKTPEEEEEEIDDASINPRLLLEAKISFYFDFYFLMIIITLFLVLNIVFLIILFKYTNNINSLSDYSTMSVELSYSQIEIGLIYIITLLRQKEALNFDKTSIFHEKIKHFTTNTEQIFIQNSYLTDLQNYNLNLYNPTACSAVISEYFSLITNTENKEDEISLCQKISGGTYAKGLILGYETIVNNLVNSYNEKKRKNFARTTTSLYDENIDTVLNTRKEVIEKNIYNTMYLIKDGTSSVSSTTSSLLTLYYILFYILFILLVCSYSFIYLYTNKSYLLLTRMETLINNLLN